MKSELSIEITSLIIFWFLKVEKSRFLILHNLEYLPYQLEIILLKIQKKEIDLVEKSNDFGIELQSFYIVLKFILLKQTYGRLDAYLLKLFKDNLYFVEKLKLKTCLIYLNLQEAQINSF